MRVLLYAKLLKETETEETIVFLVTVLSLVAFQLGGGPPGYAHGSPTFFISGCANGDPHFGTLNCFKFNVSFKFTYVKNFMCPALKVKKFEFWRFPFGGNPQFWNP